MTASATPQPEPSLHIVLVNPEIGPNTGNIGRLSLGLGARLHLVHPLGFQTDEKAVRRAGLDYWKQVDLVEHADLAAFLDWAEGRRLFLYSSHGDSLYNEAPVASGGVLVFGRESVGLPPELVARLGGWRIPLQPAVRSLNLANAVAVVAYDALSRMGHDWPSISSDARAPGVMA